MIKEGTVGRNASTGEDCGDILVFVHGYNNDQEIVLRRHKQIKKDLAELGYRGAVVSFDWPSDDRALNYLEDRSDANQTALKLVVDCIQPFSIIQRSACEINVHMLAHSTGAYVVREAFDDADDRRKVAESSWTVSQILFVAADVSSNSMKANDSKSSSIYRHCVRLTNYFNPYDAVLKLSNIKRIGVAPRAGRVGLPEDASASAVNVNCGDYYTKHESKMKAVGVKSHSWYFGDKTLAKDMAFTLLGDIDRHVIPTRIRNAAGELALKA